MIRIPRRGRFELRLADGATNPYLLQAAVIAAGLDGIATGRDPGQRLDNNMYAGGHTSEVRRCRRTCSTPCAAFEASALLNEGLGGLVPAYLKLKHEEWNSYARHLTQWERDTTLDC